MAAKTPTSAARATLAWLGALVAALTIALGVGVSTNQASWAPRLALDLEGGTQMVLAPQTSSGEQVTPEQLQQAVEIIRARVDGSGVSEAEVATQGADNVVVSLPGTPDAQTRRLILASADMQFRPVLQAGDAAPVPKDQRVPKKDFPTPDGKPADAYDPNWLTPELMDRFQKTDCRQPRDPSADPLPEDKATVVCQPPAESADGQQVPGKKYIVGPVLIPGTDIKDASNGMSQTSSGVSTSQWVVNISFNEAGSKAFAEVTRRLTPMPDADPRKQFAIVLDDEVVSAPQSNAVITNGQAQISGPTLDEKGTAELAEQLGYGALPISFTMESEQQISATLGQDQLFWGLIAGLIGLALVAVFQFFQYRLLGLLTFGSILVMGVLTYLAIALLGWTDNYRLSLAGIAGLIVAIGLTADSFIVYFERIKDELRAGHGIESAVHEGWKRARRTIWASKAVNLLAALVLYFVAVGNVRGFAFTLGLTAIADLIVVFWFTHPMMILLAQTRTIGGGHRWSGLDPTLLGREPLYKGAGRFRDFSTLSDHEAAGAAAASAEADEDSPVRVGPAGLGATGSGTSTTASRRRRGRRREQTMTIAERRRAAQRAADDQQEEQ